MSGTRLLPDCVAWAGRSSEPLIPFQRRPQTRSFFEYAARHGHVFVTNDKGIQRIAVAWIAESRPCRMIFWEQGQGRRGAPADSAVIAAIEALAQNPYAFGYPIEYIKGRR